MKLFFFFFPFPLAVNYDEIPFPPAKKKKPDHIPEMAAIGSLVFCTDCGNLLPVSKGNVKNILHCECCGAENRGSPWLCIPMDDAS